MKPTTLRHGLLLLAALCLAGTALAAPPRVGRAVPAEGTRLVELQEFADVLQQRAAARRTPTYFELIQRTTGPQAALNLDRDLKLVGMADGRPLFYHVNNLVAAASVGADAIWPGGSAGLNLDGANLRGELAIWDAGAVRVSHQEFGGRVVVQDASPATHYHATHVAGTLSAAGVDPAAKGMSYASLLDSYDWVDDEVEMALAASNGLLVSQHSYAFVAGWRWDSTDSVWYWYGDVDLSTTEDAGFGSYSVYTQEWDQIAHDAPYYLISKSAGNDRNDYGPTPGDEHYFWNPAINDWDLSTAVRDADGGGDGFDTITYKGNAKNILTVGAVLDVPGGYAGPGSVVMSSFSNWGPTDDGRIKPDIVANGVGLYSSIDSGDADYASYSGTSMAGPNAAGALHQVAQYWIDVHGSPARSATLKALAIHTAEECGANDGPDYAYGWGLLNVEAAAGRVTADAAFDQTVVESVLADGQADTLTLWADGLDAIKATLVWNDVPGTPPPWSLNDPTPMLVNDLDLRIERVTDSTLFLPWTLNPVNRYAAAQHGDNVLDNVERIDVSPIQVGEYRVIVSHKGSLSGGFQFYSLVTGGLGALPAPPQVSNVAFAQRTDGSGLVDVSFDLADDDSPLVLVFLLASDDGGATFDLVTTSATGDLGVAVPVGAGKSIVWDFAADNPGVYLDEVVVRIHVLDGS